MWFNIHFLARDIVLGDISDSFIPQAWVILTMAPAL